MEDKELTDSPQDLWWAQVVKGISSIIFGVLILVWPAATIGVIAILFASLFAIFGTTDLILGIKGISKNLSSIFRVLLGIIEIAVVIFLFKNAGSGLTLEVMGLLMAINFVILSAIMIGSAFLSDMSMGYKIGMGLAGALTLFAGITAFRAPILSVTTLIYVLGVFGLFMGPLNIALGLMLKNKEA